MPEAVAIRQPHPPKRAGQALGPRRFNGELLDVAEAARFLGTSEKCVRARIARRLVPFRRMGGRIVFLREELRNYVETLPGCTLDEARENLRMRGGL